MGWLMSSLEINFSTSRVLLIVTYQSISDLNLYRGYPNPTEFGAMTCLSYVQSYQGYVMLWLIQFNPLLD